MRPELIMSTDTTITSTSDCIYITYFSLTLLTINCTRKIQIKCVPKIPFHATKEISCLDISSISASKYFLFRNISEFKFLSSLGTTDKLLVIFIDEKIYYHRHMETKVRAYFLPRTQYCLQLQG